MRLDNTNRDGFMFISYLCPKINFPSRCLPFYGIYKQIHGDHPLFCLMRPSCIFVYKNCLLVDFFFSQSQLLEL